MEIRVLKYFLMVAREENITKAAEFLHVTQPTLSRQIMQLEEELNCKLFKRSNHSIYLTEEGMLLKKRAQDIVALEERTRIEFRSRQEDIAGSIAIGSGETKGFNDIARIMVAFREENPRVSYDIYTANADDIKERLDRGLADFGILTEPVDISQYNFIRLEQNETWGIIVRRDWDIAEKDMIRVADVASLPLIVVRRSLVQKELAGWFGDKYDNLQIAATYNLINNALAMAQNGLGAVLCLDLHNSLAPDLKFIPLSPVVRTGSVLVWRKNQLLSEASYQFLEYLKKYTESISEKQKEH